MNLKLLEQTPGNKKKKMEEHDGRLGRNEKTIEEHNEWLNGQNRELQDHEDRLVKLETPYCKCLLVGQGFRVNVPLFAMEKLHMQLESSQKHRLMIAQWQTLLKLAYFWFSFKGDCNGEIVSHEMLCDNAKE